MANDLITEKVWKELGYVAQEEADSQFQNDPRKKIEIASRPIIREIYKGIFGPGVEIRYMNGREERELDILDGIDLLLRPPTVERINKGQEKVLDYDKRYWRALTVEYMNDPVTGELGNFFTMKAEFYFCGYFTGPDHTVIDPWVIVRWGTMRRLTRSIDIPWTGPMPNRGRAKANFLFVEFTHIPEECILSCSWK